MLGPERGREAFGWTRLVLSLLSLSVEVIFSSVSSKSLILLDAL